MPEHTVLDALGEYGNDCPIDGYSTFGYLSKPFCSLPCARIGLARSRDWKGLSPAKLAVLEDRLARDDALNSARRTRSRAAATTHRQPLRRAARALATLQHVPLDVLASDPEKLLDVARREERLGRVLALPRYLEHVYCTQGKDCPEHRLLRAIGPV